MRHLLTFEAFTPKKLGDRQNSPEMIIKMSSFNITIKYYHDGAKEEIKPSRNVMKGEVQRLLKFFNDQGWQCTSKEQEDAASVSTIVGVTANKPFNDINQIAEMLLENGFCSDPCNVEFLGKMYEISLELGIVHNVSDY